MEIKRFAHRWFFVANIFFVFAITSMPVIASAEDVVGEAKTEKLVEEKKPEVDKNFLALFENRSYPLSDKAEDEGIGYKIFVPTIKSGEKYPLIIWLNGSSVDDDENAQIEQQQVLKSTIFQNPKRRNKYRFFLLIPQLPKGVKSWARAKKDAIFNIVQEVQAKHPVDSDRISLVGILAGGADAWEIAKTKPEVFATLSSISSSEINVGGLDGLKNMLVWVFHNGEDHPEHAKALVAELKQVGGKGFFTETGGDNSKDSWTEAFGEYELLTWLTTQKHETSLQPVSKNAPPTDFKSMFAEYWPQGAFVGCLIICFIAIKRDAARKRKANTLQIDSELSNGNTAEGNSASNKDLASPHL